MIIDGCVSSLIDCRRINKPTPIVTPIIINSVVSEITLFKSLLDGVDLKVIQEWSILHVCKRLTVDVCNSCE